ncbi:hypothetical protein NDU88_001507 [Pleurodeles waltl]|uniref:Uncharacterized protein n=1 Tax=Pleurodeles waltl TaxID=8319 RepID=A0AAV7M8D9_PLEWA|nr:hypothetical protein NDU88_001507 [Pleurodeles waltl]
MLNRCPGSLCPFCTAPSRRPAESPLERSVSCLWGCPGACAGPVVPWSLFAARRTRGTAKISPARSGSGVAVESSSPSHPRRDGGARREKGHRRSRSATGPVGIVGPPQRDAPLTFVRVRTPLQPWLGSHHTVFRSLLSGPHTAPGYSGQRGRPVCDCEPPPRHGARDLRTSSPAVRHVGCRQPPRLSMCLSSPQVEDDIYLSCLVPGGSKVSRVTPWL